MHKVCLELCLLNLLSLLLPSQYVLSYQLVLKILSRIQPPSPRHRCGSVIPSPPAPAYFLAVPKVELEARHPRAFAIRPCTA